MSSFTPNHLARLGNQVNIPIKTDNDGYLGRECPVAECLGYFKITPGTGIKGPAPCRCPYCGQTGDTNTFWTQEQLEYAKSVVIRHVTEALHKDLKSMEFDHKPTGALGIGISLKFKPGAPHPIKYYRERELETEIVCESCTLRYAIYGVFGWCPDCGVHNSLQILSKNLEFARKELVLAAAVDRDLANHLVGDSLQNVVSAFDGFGREICAKKSVDIQFQNLIGARRRVEATFAFDFADTVTRSDWETACRVFQKRHLLAHKMGVVDEDYLKKTNDPQAVLGRKIAVTPGEVTSIISIVEALGKRLFNGLLRPAP
ncbi:MAG TPA: hypothetical protein VGH51_18360 [Candidatus Angelobacter sp.]